MSKKFTKIYLEGRKKLLERELKRIEARLDVAIDNGDATAWRNARSDYDLTRYKWQSVVCRLKNLGKHEGHYIHERSLPSGYAIN